MYCFVNFHASLGRIKFQPERCKIQIIFPTQKSYYDKSDSVTQCSTYNLTIANSVSHIPMHRRYSHT